MRLKVITVGKIKDTSLRALCEDFGERLIHYTPLDILEIKEEKITAARSRDEILKQEGQRILKITRPNSLVALDVQGRQMSSEELAAFLKKHLDQSQKELAFVIGGPLGLAETVTTPAIFRWSLSKLTFPHEMARYIVLEQLYRAFTILKGEHYHK